MSDESQLYALHADPIWRDRADFIVNATLPENDSAKKYEQLWVRKLGPGEFEICCIPFFVYDIALGDVVRTATLGNLPFMVDNVVKQSGHFTFRAWLGDSQCPRLEVIEGLAAIGVLLEWSSRSMVAIDARDEAQAAVVANYLWVQEQMGGLIYETGRTE